MKHFQNQFIDNKLRRQCLSIQIYLPLNCSPKMLNRAVFECKPTQSLFSINSTVPISILTTKVKIMLLQMLAKCCRKWKNTATSEASAVSQLSPEEHEVISHGNCTSPPGGINDFQTNMYSVDPCFQHSNSTTPTTSSGLYAFVLQ